MQSQITDDKKSSHFGSTYTYRAVLVAADCQCQVEENRARQYRRQVEQQVSRAATRHLGRQAGTPALSVYSDGILSLLSPHHQLTRRTQCSAPSYGEAVGEKGKEVLDGGGCGGVLFSL